MDIMFLAKDVPIVAQNDRKGSILVILSVFVFHFERKRCVIKTISNEKIVILQPIREERFLKWKTVI